MLDPSFPDQCPPAPIQIKSNDNLLNIIAFLDQENLMYSSGSSTITSEVENKLSATPISELKNGSIFVCTFCQVYAFSNTVITEHIAKEHKNALKEGTIPESYVSILQALKSDKKSVRKVGRPRKNHNLEKISSTIVKEEESVSIPPVESDGLYYCKKCHKSFKRARQINRHVCCQTNNQESLDEIDVDDSTDFKSNMDIQPTPWKRAASRKNIHIVSLQPSKSDNTDSFDNSNNKYQEKETKIIPKWRDDSSYVPIFTEESEKKAFEKHLSSFDYSFIDELFVMLGKKSKALKTKKGKKMHPSIYSCVVCEKEFDSLSHVRRHCLIHTDFKPFTCPKCPYRSNIKASLHTHMRSHTGNLFRCSLCNYQSDKRSHLLDHEQTHSSDPILCQLCKNMYKTMKSLVFHVKKYHNNANGKKYIKFLSHKQSCIVTECEICNKTFTSHLSLQTHKQNDHIPSINSSEIESNSEKVSEHQSKSAIVTNTQNIPKSADCSVMLEPLDDQLNNNLQYNFVCNICDQYFSSQSLLENHSLHVHCPIISTERLEGLEAYLSYSNFQTQEQSDYTSITSLNSLENPASTEKAPEALSENTNLAFTQSVSTFLDCSVMLKPLDNQLINYLPFNFVCNICNQKFYSQPLLEKHTLLVHCPIVTAERLDNLEIRRKMPEDSFIGSGFNETQALSSLSECSVRLEPLDVELMLNNILQDKNEQSDVLFDDNVFQQSQSSDLLSSNTGLSECVSSNSAEEKLLPINDIDQFHLTGTSLLKECQDKLNIDILDECLRQSNITNDVISSASCQISETSLSSGQTEQPPEFDLQTMALDFSDTELMSEVLPESSMENILQLETEFAEPKSEEIELFEKCKRAPAYVCCVCSSIFIYPSTLKVHLKEHINKSYESNSLVQECAKKCQSSALPHSKDDFCRILQGSSSSDADNELEKLYTSSLHKMWNLKEVSVVLEDNRYLIDDVLDEISNFPISTESC